MIVSMALVAYRLDRAGWSEADAATAIALAAQTSAMRTDWRATPQTFGAADRRGLWGIDYRHHSELVDVDLLTLDGSIAAATRLHAENGANWWWCPAWPGSPWRQYLPDAGAAVKAPQPVETLGYTVDPRASDSLPVGAVRDIMASIDGIARAGNAAR